MIVDRFPAQEHKVLTKAVPLSTALLHAVHSHLQVEVVVASVLDGIIGDTLERLFTPDVDSLV